MWVLIKGLPEEAAVWREERRKFNASEDGTAMVSHAWATAFDAEVKPEITHDPAEIRRFFAGLT